MANIIMYVLPGSVLLEESMNAPGANAEQRSSDMSFAYPPWRLVVDMANKALGIKDFGVHVRNKAAQSVTKRRVSNNDKTKKERPTLAATPGNSPHEHGAAQDTGSTILQNHRNSIWKVMINDMITWQYENPITKQRITEYYGIFNLGLSGRQFNSLGRNICAIVRNLRVFSGGDVGVAKSIADKANVPQLISSHLEELMNGTLPDSIIKTINYERWHYQLEKFNSDGSTIGSFRGGEGRGAILDTHLWLATTAGREEVRRRVRDWYAQGMVQISTAGGDTAPPEGGPGGPTIADFVDKIYTEVDAMLLKYAKRMADYEFFLQHWQGRQAQLVLPYNPNLVAGFPIKIHDIYHNGKERILLGFIEQLTHSISIDGRAITTITVSMIRTPEEEAELRGIIPSEFYPASSCSELYSQLGFSTHNRAVATLEDVIHVFHKGKTIELLVEKSSRKEDILEIHKMVGGEREKSSQTYRTELNTTSFAYDPEAERAKK